MVTVAFMIRCTDWREKWISIIVIDHPWNFSISINWLYFRKSMSLPQYTAAQHIPAPWKEACPRDIEKFSNLSVIFLDFENSVSPNTKIHRKQFNFLSVRMEFCQSKSSDWHFSRTQVPCATCAYLPKMAQHFQYSIYAAPCGATRKINQIQHAPTHIVILAKIQDNPHNALEWAAPYAHICLKWCNTFKICCAMWCNPQNQ